MRGCMANLYLYKSRIGLGVLTGLAFGAAFLLSAPALFAKPVFIVALPAFFIFLIVFVTHPPFVVAILLFTRALADRGLVETRIPLFGLYTGVGGAINLIMILLGAHFLITRP